MSVVRTTPVELFIEVDSVKTVGQAFARLIARSGPPDQVGTRRTLYSSLVYDFPDEGRSAETNLLSLFADRVRRLTEDS